MKNAPVALCGWALLAGLGAALPSATARPSVSVPANVAAVLEKRCVECHEGREAAMGLSLDPEKISEAIDAPSREIPSLKIIDTADPESSYLLKKILGSRDINGSKMPRLRRMSREDVEVLKAWILGLKEKEGARPAPS
jgi:mono/diheme cytochrome c family protein